MTLPEDLKYAESHEWVRVEADVATIGISDHAQAELTDIVFVELPEIGKQFEAGDACAVVESVKTASDIYSPIGGEVIEVNEKLVDQPELVNQSAFTEGWFFKLKIIGFSAPDSLMTAEQYGEHIS
jgi:glycine cleavage system H protein